MKPAEGNICTFCMFLGQLVSLVPFPFSDQGQLWDHNCVNCEMLCHVVCVCVCVCACVCVFVCVPV